MSARQAKRAFDAANEFYAASMEGDEFVIARTARVLATRSLGDKHFSQLERFFKNLDAASKIKVESALSYDPHVPLARRRLSAKSLHMGFGTTDAGSLAMRKYIPLSLEAEIAHNHIDYRVRPLPLQFISSHTEERFEFWRRRETDYASADFKRALTFGLALTFPLEKIMIERKQPSMPISIPYAGGLYLGNISLYPAKKNLFHQPAIYAHRDIQQGKLIASDGLTGNALPPFWQPVSVITLITHVSRLWPEQTALSTKLEEVLGTAAARRGLDAAIPVYTSVRPSNSQADIFALQTLQQQLGELARSPLWDKAHEGGWKHIDRDRPQFRNM